MSFKLDLVVPQIEAEAEEDVLIGADEERKQIYCKLYPSAILSPRSRTVGAIHLLLSSKEKQNIFSSVLN